MTKPIDQQAVEILSEWRDECTTQEQRMSQGGYCIVVKTAEQIWEQLKPDTDALHKFLEHGDEKHRQWLKEAIEAFFNGDDRPEPY